MGLLRSSWSSRCQWKIGLQGWLGHPQTIPKCQLPQKTTINHYKLTYSNFYLKALSPLGFFCFFVLLVHHHWVGHKSWLLEINERVCDWSGSSKVIIVEVDNQKWSSRSWSSEVNVDVSRQWWLSPELIIKGGFHQSWHWRWLSKHGVDHVWWSSMLVARVWQQ